MREETVVISTFLDEDRLAGARFYLGGPIFILYINDRPLKPGPLRFTRNDGSVEERAQPQYHSKEMRFQLGKYVFQSIRFNW